MPRSPPRLPKNRGSRDPSRRERILEVARRHFTRFGYRHANIDNIAAEVGCAKGALYLEFEGKNELLRAVVDQVRAEIRDQWMREVVAMPSPLARIRAALRFGYHVSAAEPIFDRLLLEHPQTAPTPQERAGIAATTAAVGQWVEEGIREGEIREDADPDVVRSMFAVLRFAPKSLERAHEVGLLPGEPMIDAHARLHRRLDAIVDTFLQGIARPTAHRSTRK